MKQIKPPRLANILLRMILRREDYLEKTGDLEEVYSSLKDEKGRAIAGAWYWIQTIKAIPAIIINSFYWSMIMLKNYFKIALRKLLQQKMYSLITITGLAVGLGVFLYIVRFYSWRTDTDAFHKDIDRTYNVVQVLNSPGEGGRHTEYIPYPLINVIKNNIPEIENITSFVYSDQVIFESKENKFFENSLIYADSNFLSFFDFNVIEGNAESMLLKPNSIVLTKAMSIKYFGNENPLGKIITMRNKTELVVTGIVADLDSYPNISSINYDFIISMDVYNSLGNKPEDWNKKDYVGFIKLRKGIGAGQINEKLSGILNKYFPKSPESPKLLYAYPTSENEFGDRNIKTYYSHNNMQPFIIILVLGVLILVIVNINYLNLATARYTDRAKEVGIRKAVGASRSQLIRQFLGETILTTLFAIPLACAVYIIFGSWINDQLGIIGVNMSISFLANKWMLPILLITSFITSFLSGLYPSFILSSLQPINLLRTKIKAGKKKGGLRKTLVIGQIVVSIVFIVISLTWIKQADFVHNSDLGYNRKNVNFIEISSEAQSNFPQLKEELRKNPDFLSIAGSKGTPGRWVSSSMVIPEGKTGSEAMRSYIYGIGYDFIETINMQLISGRSFSKYYNDENGFVINQLFAKRLGWNDPIGKNLEFENKKGIIIGVVNDFHFASQGDPKLPSVLYLEQKELNKIFIKVTGTNDFSKIKELVKSAWNKFSPNMPLEITTLESHFNTINLGNTYIPARFMGVLGVIAMFFSSLGLLAMVSFSARSRRKEIAIRKVHGASMMEILVMLGNEYTKIIIYASIIGIPIACFLTDTLFNMFRSRVPIGMNVLLATVFLTVTISSAFIFKEIVTAAKQAPIDTLKSE